MKNMLYCGNNDEVLNRLMLEFENVKKSNFTKENGVYIEQPKEFECIFVDSEDLTTINAAISYSRCFALPLIVTTNNDNYIKIKKDLELFSHAYQVHYSKTVDGAVAYAKNL